MAKIFDGTWVCDFCGKTQHEVVKIVVADDKKQGSTAICNECIDLSAEIVHDDNDKDAPAKLRKLSRTIEFPPEYRQAGIAILSYFSEILIKRYPDAHAKVRIEQEGKSVRMTIETSTGDIEVVEKTLEEYGLVVQGLRAPEEFMPNPLDAMALRNKLEIASLELRHTRDLLSITSGLHETRVKSLEGQISELHTIISSHLTVTATLANSLKDLPASLNSGPALQKAIDVIAQLIASGTLLQNRDLVEEKLRFIEEHELTLFDRVKEVSRHSAGSAAGHALYSWAVAIANALPK